jgi:hypothetical protein
METAQVYDKIPDRFPPWPHIHRISREETSEMHAKLICHPPLGQSTVVPAATKTIQFRVALEVDAAGEKSWEAVLWHHHGPSEEWKAETFEKASADRTIVCLASDHQDNPTFSPCNSSVSVL